MSAIVHVGNVLDILPTLEAGSVNCCICSPPYWGLRDYGTATWEGGDAECVHTVGGQVQDGKAPGAITSGVRPGVDSSRCLRCGARRIDSQLGLEATPELYVANMVAVFREVRRVLRDDGTLWLNLGDSYAATTKGSGGHNPKQDSNAGSWHDERAWSIPKGLKPKDLVGIPWRVAFALQADGWYLRSDVIWSKPNPMPESVTDRPTKAHEYVFLLTKSARYWYDWDAICERSVRGGMAPGGNRNVDASRNDASRDVTIAVNPTRNRRTVWTIATQPYPEAHFATYPEKLVEPCVLAGCPAKVCGECGAPWERVVELGDVTSTGGSSGGSRDMAVISPLGQDKNNGAYNAGAFTARAHVTRGWQPTCDHDAPAIPGTVLDPFTGSGTTGAVACRLGRNFVGIELSPEYAEMAERRIAPHRDQMQLEVT